MDDADWRSVVWMGDSRKRMGKMPKLVQKAIGFQLQAAQKGDKPRLAKPFKGVGSGVWEICKDYDSDTFRAVYAVQVGKKIYVLHAFQKKSKTGIKTPQADVELILKRYRDALQLEKELGNDDK
jgi:phage-related protein